MMHRLRNVVGRFLVVGAVFAIAVVAAPLAAQQTTGKIEGTVSDQAGAAVANAQVFVVGTSFGAVTNEKGYYFVNNVPVGTYSLRAQFIGFAPSELRNVRVLGGQTITQDIKMQSSAVVLTGITVTAAANPIVPRDQVTSKAILAGDLVDHLPVDDVRSVLSLTPGVVESGANAGVSIRGGRPGEANVYIDGAPIRGTNSGGALATLGTNAIEEASVTTGALGVEFSDAQSGVISYTTKAGGNTLSGSGSWETDNASTNSSGLNRFEGSLGGPVPGVQNLRFFGSAVLIGQVSGTPLGNAQIAAPVIGQGRGMGAEDQPVFVRAGVDTLVPTVESDGSVSTIALPRYVQYSGKCGAFGSSANAVTQEIRNNYGVECQGIRRPMDWNSSIQLQSKLQYTYGSGSSVSLTGLAGGFQARNTPGRNLNDPAIYSGVHTWTRMAILNLNHQVSRSAERSLAINANLAWARDRGIAGPLTNESETNTRDPALGLQIGALDFAGFDNFPFPITDQIIRDQRTNSGTRGVPLFGAVPDVTQSGRINPFGMINQFPTEGFATTATLLSETRLTGRLVVDWQANRYHRFTLGGDAKRTNLAFWSSNLARQIFMDAYVVKPVQYGLFASDRLDLGDVVLELGARWDYYNSHALFSNTPLFISSAGPALWNPISATDDTAYANSVARTFTPAVGHHTISPRLRVSFPITEHTGFRLSYSHQVQSPEFTTLMSGINNDISFTNTNDVVGRDLDFGKSILFEFGVRHAFSQDLVLDVSAYNKDKVSDFAARVLTFPDPKDSTVLTGINVLTNRDFGNARGVDTKLDWRIGTNLSTSVAYTFQVSKNTGSDPFSYLNTFARQVSGLGDRTPPPEAAQRTNDDRTHNLAGSVALQLPPDYRKGTTIGAILRDVGIFATFRVQSGLPYTRLENNGDGQTAPRLSFGLGGRTATGTTLNAFEMPWTKNVDLRLNKGVRFGRLDATLYADVRNLLNFRNVVGLFAETGDVRNDKNRIAIIGDPTLATGSAEYAALWDEASNAGAFNSADKSVDVSSCAAWGSQVNCVSLRRVEARFGNGDGIYTLDEQERAFNTAYDAFNGSWRFYAAARQVRLGVELKF
ncbi:MAG TPA: TonB-dependent receptor [Gemmatimonadales bacterium]|nr:TonB-dependent receptor [Gemmatimonadales bacterium]